MVRACRALALKGIFNQFLLDELQSTWARNSHNSLWVAAKSKVSPKQTNMDVYLIKDLQKKKEKKHLLFHYPHSPVRVLRQVWLKGWKYFQGAIDFCLYWIWIKGAVCNF